ncbi:exfoliative toxin [Streptococcus pneumoniae]|nr:exfoliative toxin [Streptococcus pneumoniae]
MKKLPLVFSGCLLGLAGAGNLILDTLPVLSHLFSLTGLVLWIYFLILHLFNWKETKQELTKPPLLSGMATFPMAGMGFFDLCLSRILLSSFGSTRDLVVFISLGFDLDCWFYHQVCLSRAEGSCHSKLDGSLCGDSSGCLDLSSGRYYRNCLCDLEFWFSLDLLSLSPYL